jgi:hypothetical protein
LGGTASSAMTAILDSENPDRYRLAGLYIGAPQPETETKPGDTLVLYGKEDRLQELSGRHTGDIKACGETVEDHEETLKQQEQLIEQ